MKENGFSLIEILITTVIMGIILALTAPVFKTIIVGSKSEISSEESYLDKISALELVRLDLLHTGFGIGTNEAQLPIEWNNSTSTLTLRSTMNNTNQATLGWMQFECINSGDALSSSFLSSSTDHRHDTSNNNIVVINGSNKQFLAPQPPPSDSSHKYSNASSGTCPNEGVFFGFPVDKDVANGCDNQWCNKIEYELKGTPLDHCAQGTFSLRRKVGNSAAGDPIVNCVADVDVQFHLDTDGDGVIDTTSPTSSLSGMTTTNILQQVKNIDIYFVYQHGRKEQSASAAPTLTIPGGTLNLSGVADNTFYRWKVQHINGKLMSW